MTRPAPADPLLGRQISGCLIKRLLGKGCMGAVYLAQRSDGLPIVLKFLAPVLAHNEELRKRFRREGEALRKVPTHPNLVGVFGIHGEDPHPFLAMEFVAGTSLLGALQRHKRLAPLQATRVARDVARGLAAMHQVGIVHRDVKPANVIVSDQGQAKLVDFGLARDAALSTLTQPGQIMGTASYMAPEQWADEPIHDACGDVFALGATLYHLLTGRPPFVGKDFYEIAGLAMAGQYPPLREQVPEVPEALEWIVVQMLFSQRRFRYATAESCAEDLERFLQGQTPSHPCLIQEGVQGKPFPLLPGDAFTLGSDPDCTPRIAHPSVSGRHAQIRREEQGYVLCDLRSATGTFRGDQRVEFSPLVLGEGERIRVGEVSLILRDPREPPPVG